MSDPDDYETWSTEDLCNHASWLYEQDAAGEGDYYDDLAKIAAVLNERDEEHSSHIVVMR